MKVAKYAVLLIALVSPLLIAAQETKPRTPSPGSSSGPGVKETVDWLRGTLVNRAVFLETFGPSNVEHYSIQSCLSLRVERGQMLFTRRVSSNDSSRGTSIWSDSTSVVETNYTIPLARLTARATLKFDPDIPTGEVRKDWGEERHPGVWGIRLRVADETKLIVERSRSAEITVAGSVDYKRPDRYSLTLWGANKSNRRPTQQEYNRLNDSDRLVELVSTIKKPKITKYNFVTIATVYEKELAVRIQKAIEHLIKLHGGKDAPF